MRSGKEKEGEIDRMGRKDLGDSEETRRGGRMRRIA